MFNFFVKLFFHVRSIHIAKSTYNIYTVLTLLHIMQMNAGQMNLWLLFALTYGCRLVVTVDATFFKL